MKFHKISRFLSFFSSKKPSAQKELFFQKSVCLLISNWFHLKDNDNVRNEIKT